MIKFFNVLQQVSFQCGASWALQIFQRKKRFVKDFLITFSSFLFRKYLYFQDFSGTSSENV